MSESQQNRLLYVGMDAGDTKCQVTLTDSNLNLLASVLIGRSESAAMRITLFYGLKSHKIHADKK